MPPPKNGHLRDRIAFNTNGFRLLASVVAILGCDGPRELAVRDTEGRAFTVSCPTEGPCRLTQAKTDAASDAAPELRRGGRVIGVCDGPTVNAYDCRPLRCESSDDCPHERNQPVECSRRFCIDPARRYTREDIVMLCLSGTGAGHDLPVQRERYLRALESGEPPRVPPGCPSP